MPDIMIGGEWVDAGGAAEVRSPWDGSVAGIVGLANEAQIERAIDAARAAAPALARMPTWRRREMLTAIARGIEAQRDELATLIAREAGKPITLARMEVQRAVHTFTLGAEECARLGGDALALDLNAASESMVGAWTRVPAGPVLAIAPFNFPLNLVAHKLSPAFALGAPVVLKPPPQAPLTSIALARIVMDAGAPPGLLSVVPTSNELADRMVRDERFAVVSFTGSARVGWGIKARAGKKRVLLELGGNAALIVEPDADVDHAIKRALTASYGYAGQVCVRVQRVLVHASIARRVTDALIAGTRAMSVMDPLDANAVCGPLIDEASGTRVQSWLDEACTAGATVLAGGPRIGNRMAPTLVANAREGTKLVDEEIFGPVLTVHSYDTLETAIATIERGRYGLQAGIFTHDLRAVRTAFASLHVGALIVNEAPSFRVDSMPYGGVKDSGLGREGVRFAIDEMSEKRLLVVRG